MLLPVLSVCLAFTPSKLTPASNQPLARKCAFTDHGRSFVRMSEGDQWDKNDKLTQEAKALSLSWSSLRMGVYAVVGLGGAAGLTDAVPDVFSGAESDAVAGVVADAATVFAAATCAYVDSSISNSPRTKPAPTAATSLGDWTDAAPLRVQLKISEKQTRAAPLETMLGTARQTVVLLGGPHAWLRKCLIGARLYSELFRSGNVLLVPIEVEDSGRVAAAAPSKSGSGKGFGATSWSDAPFVANPDSEDAAAWAVRMQAEAEAASAQGVEVEGVVIVLGRDCKVVQRRVGLPDWRPLLMQIAPNQFDATDLRRAGKAK